MVQRVINNLDHDAFSDYTTGRRSPFSTISEMYMPSSIKEVFVYAKNFYYNNPIVYSALNKLAEYAVTDFKYTGDDDEEIEKVKKLVKQLRLKSKLLEIAKNYFVYGNAIVSIFFPKKRYLICPESGTAYDIETLNFKFNPRALSFEGNSPAIDKKVKFSTKDEAINDPSKINILCWDPVDLEIRHNFLTDQASYVYKLSREIQQAVKKGDKLYLAETPFLFIEAAVRNKAVYLNQSNLYHLRDTSIAMSSRHWGKPRVMSVMKELFYLAVMKKANEALALEHITPWRYLSPAQSVGEMSPATMLDLSKWTDNITAEIKKWRRDPLTVSVFPIPVNIQQMGGQGRSMMVFPEMQETRKQIITGLEVPQEFVYGGLSWSGSSVSLRMLENNLTNFMSQLQELLEWIFNQITKYLDWKTEVQISLKPLRMADDTQRKQLLVQLFQNNQVSFQTIAEEFGIDSAKELERMNKEESKRFEDQVKGQQKLIEKSKELQEEAEKELYKKQLKGGINPENAIMDFAESYAKQIVALPSEEEKIQALEAIKKENPALAEQVYNFLVEIGVIEEGTEEESEQTETSPASKVDEPLPEKLPPRRDNAPV